MIYMLWIGHKNKSKRNGALHNPNRRADITCGNKQVLQKVEDALRKTGRYICFMAWKLK